VGEVAWNEVTIFPAQEPYLKPNRTLSLLLAVVFAFAGLAFGREVPSKPIHHHANVRKLVLAQRYLMAAYNALLAAEEAKEFDDAGHAAKAKELTAEAHEQLQQADKQTDEATKSGKIDPDGHAAKARALIEQAMQELKLATETAKGH
jgi:hypothetical protein